MRRKIWHAWLPSYSLLPPSTHPLVSSSKHLYSTSLLMTNPNHQFTHAFRASQSCYHLCHISCCLWHRPGNTQQSTFHTTILSAARTLVPAMQGYSRTGALITAIPLNRVLVLANWLLGQQIVLLFSSLFLWNKQCPEIKGPIVCFPSTQGHRNAKMAAAVSYGARKAADVPLPCVKQWWPQWVSSDLRLL